MILILNKHALNMTFNWLCNTKDMADVHRRSLIVTLDAESDAALGMSWPEIRRLNWKISCLEVGILCKTFQILSHSRIPSITETANISCFIC